MASDISYVITQSNNKTEKAAINYLLEKDSSFLNPTKSGRKRIMELLQLPRKYSRAFDLFKVPGSINSENEIVVSNVSEIQLIELKTTKKHLPNNPRGFFFGATENEFNIAKLLGVQYKFCFVCLHPDSLSYELLTLLELEELIKTKRTQFQINLKN